MLSIPIIGAHSNNSSANSSMLPTPARSNSSESTPSQSQLGSPIGSTNSLRQLNSIHNRKILSKFQKERLQSTLARGIVRPNYAQREQLAAELGMTNRAVQVWFQNQRQKFKSYSKNDYNIPNESDSSVNTSYSSFNSGHSPNSSPISSTKSFFNKDKLSIDFLLDDH